MIEIELRKYHFLEITPGDYSLEFELKEEVFENGQKTSRTRLKGFLKWDGCMNWSTETPVMYHFCENDDAKLLNEAFEKLWEIGPEYISHWLE
jgi:hypothetical protein